MWTCEGIEKRPFSCIELSVQSALKSTRRLLRIIKKTEISINQNVCRKRPTCSTYKQKTNVPTTHDITLVCRSPRPHNPPCAPWISPHSHRVPPHSRRQSQGSRLLRALALARRSRQTRVRPVSSSPRADSWSERRGTVRQTTRWDLISANKTGIKVVDSKLECLHNHCSLCIYKNWKFKEWFRQMFAQMLPQNVQEQFSLSGKMPVWHFLLPWESTQYDLGSIRWPHTLLDPRGYIKTGNDNRIC